jgi:hypothetical protein
MRIVISILLLAPPAFCMGMMFPLGLGLWRRHDNLLPFFWSANGITSMLASALGMALSIELGIAATYMIGVGFYVVCAAMMLVEWRASRAKQPIAEPMDTPGLVPQDGLAAATVGADAPSSQQLQSAASAADSMR